MSAEKARVSPSMGAKEAEKACEASSSERVIAGEKSLEIKIEQLFNLYDVSHTVPAEILPIMMAPNVMKRKLRCFSRLSR